MPAEKAPEKKEEELSWWQKVKSWLTRHEASPYIAVTDFNNSEDSPYENKPKQAVEVGVKISF